MAVPPAVSQTCMCGVKSKQLVFFVVRRSTLRHVRFSRPNKRNYWHGVREALNPGDNTCTLICWRSMHSSVVNRSAPIVGLHANGLECTSSRCAQLQRFLSRVKLD